MTDSEILKAIACVHKKYLGARSSRASRFAVLDIDIDSKYHNPDSVHKILSLLADAGLKESHVYQSSDSGGWHIYLSFDQLISTRDLHKQLTTFLQLHGFQLAQGVLEVFPHPGDASLGYGLRLPLQPGFAWLNQETLAVSFDRYDFLPGQALDRFMSDFTDEANSYHDFHQFKAHVQQLQQNRQAPAAPITTKPAQVVPIRPPKITAASKAADPAVIAIFGFLPPNIDSDRWLTGRNYYEQGLTGESQRADAVKSLSHYFFFGDPSRQVAALGYGCKQERDWAMNAVIFAKHNGYSDEINKGRPDARAHITRAANWVPPRLRGQKITPYVQTTPVVWIKANAKRSMDGRKRIEDAVVKLNGHPFSLRTLKTVAKCSMDTLYKNQDLWQDAYDQFQHSHLASDPGVYNVVEAGSVVPPSVLLCLDSSETPWLLNVTALKAFLIAYLSTAPDSKSLSFVRGQIARFKSCLPAYSDNRLYVVRPP